MRSAMLIRHILSKKTKHCNVHSAAATRSERRRCGFQENNSEQNGVIFGSPFCRTNVRGRRRGGNAYMIAELTAAKCRLERFLWFGVPRGENECVCALTGTLECESPKCEPTWTEMQENIPSSSSYAGDAPHVLLSVCEASLPTHVSSCCERWDNLTAFTIHWGCDRGFFSSLSFIQYTLFCLQQDTNAATATKKLPRRDWETFFFFFFRV